MFICVFNAPALHTQTKMSLAIISLIVMPIASIIVIIGAVYHVRIVAMSTAETLPLHKKVRLVLLLASLDVLLPTVDVATDLMLSVKLFTTGYRCEIRLGDLYQQ